jgi:hypothetical protein
MCALKRRRHLKVRLRNRNDLWKFPHDFTLRNMQGRCAAVNTESALEADSWDGFCLAGLQVQEPFTRVVRT